MFVKMLISHEICITGGIISPEMESALNSDL